jgi:ubiquinone/menaquinone biosynthesis C-methylase UbiE
MCQGAKFLGLNNVADPDIPDWSKVELPDAWPDLLRLWHPADLAIMLRRVFAHGAPKVDLPDGLQGSERIPNYSLIDFHNLPNGNYSKRFTRAYTERFDGVMLGYMRRIRERMAQRAKDCASILDIGCGGGALAAAFRRQGIADVWGLDPSPYLLQHAAAANPGIPFVQGTAENTGFPAGRFDAVAVCFVLHEIPGQYIRHSLGEFHRIMKTGGLLQISEPSATQLQQSMASLWQAWGWRGWYFGLLARLVREPFVSAWHRLDTGALLAAHGFELVADNDEMPIRHIEARRI